MKTKKIRGALGFVRDISLPRAPAQCTFDVFAPCAKRHPSPSILYRPTAAPSRDAERTLHLARRATLVRTRPSAPREKNVHSCCKIILQSFHSITSIALTPSSAISSVLVAPPGESLRLFSRIAWALHVLPRSLSLSPPPPALLAKIQKRARPWTRRTLFLRVAVNEKRSPPALPRRKKRIRIPSFPLARKYSCFQPLISSSRSGVCVIEKVL